MKKKTLLIAFVLLFLIMCIWGGVLFNREYTNIVVVECSDNIDINDLENLVNDNKAISVLAGEGYFILDFNGEINLNRIEIKTEGNEEVVAESTDYSGKKKYEEIAIGKWYLGGGSVKCSCLKISFKSDYSMTIDKIKIYGQSNVAQYMYTADELLFDGKDVRNPLNPYRRPICKYVRCLAEDILKNKGKDISDHEKVMCFMEYISDYKIGYNKGGRDDYLLNVIVRKIGSCGDYSNLLAALCTTQGIESRLLTLGNYPKNNGHAVVEIKIDGKWAVYDPTYALYYTMTPEDEKHPTVLSFEELRNGYGRNATRVIASESHITGKVSYEFMGPDIYELANPAGEVSLHNKLYYPMYVEFSENKVINPSAFQGGNYLGIASISNAHIWTISGFEKEQKYRITVTSDGMVGENKEAFKTYVEVKNASIEKNNYMIWNGNQDEVWEIELSVYDSEIELVIDYSETGDEYHYILLNSIKIEKIE